MNDKDRPNGKLLLHIKWGDERRRLHRHAPEWPEESPDRKGLPWPGFQEDYWERTFGICQLIGQVRCPVCRHDLVPRTLAEGPKYCCACPGVG